MNLFRPYIILSICFLLSATLRGQQFLTRNFGTQDGLPHANVYRIFQDKRGFLWFSTDYGISVYNGQSFNSTFPDKNGLLNRAVMSVFEDDNGTKYANGYKNGLMVVADSAVTKYPIATGTYPAFSMYAAMDHSAIWVIGKPWLYRVVGNRVVRRRVSDSAGKEVEFYTLVKTDTGLFASSANGVYYIRDTSVTQVFGSIESGPVVDVAREANGTYWLGCRTGIKQVVNGQLIREYRLRPGQLVKDILVDSRHDLWVSLDGDGMLRIHNGVLTNITGALVFNKTIVNDILEDREGNIWLATYGAGIYRISATEVVSYQAESNNPNIFCRALCTVNDKILVGSVGKIREWNDGIIRPFPCASLKLDVFIYFIRKLNNTLYIGTSKGLISKNLATGSERQYTAGRAYAALSMCADSAGSIWVGDYRNLYRLENNILVHDSLHNPYMGRHNAMLCRHNGDLWHGTDSGIYVWPKDAAKPPEPAFHDRNVNDLAEDAQHRVWAATDNGLVCFSNGRYKVLTKADGLSSAKCNTLAFDSSGRLWVGTLMGLSYVDLNTLKVARYTRELITADVLSLAYHRGKLFAGTVNRLVSVDLADVASVPTETPLYITEVKTPGALFHMPRQVHLPYNQHHLVINYIALNYRAPQSVLYGYKIAELDDEWRYTRSNSVEYPAMPSGSYHFAISARANDGPWSGTVMIPIVIDTPFWKTWWFIITAVVAISMLTYILLRHRVIAQQEKRRQRLMLYNKMIYLKQQALSALINPHFMFNCMNSIQYYLDANENDKANIYLADFAHLLRMTLEDAQKVYISLESEIARIKLYLSLEQLRFGDGLEYHVVVDAAIDQHNSFIPNMVLQTYVENAVWHGITPKDGKGIIDITFTKLAGEEIRITVRDNGVGINSKQEAQTSDGHYGMKLTEERLLLLSRLSQQKYQVRYETVTGPDGSVAGTLVELIVTVQPADIPLALFEDDDLVGPLPHS